MSDYQLGKMTLNKSLVQDAAKFSEQASTIDGATPNRPATTPW